MKLFYDAFKLAYPEAWARITRDLSPAQRGGLSGGLPDTIHDRCVYFLRMRQHRVTQVARKPGTPDQVLRFESLPANA